MAFIVTVPVTEHPDSWTACVQHAAMGLRLCTAGATGHGPFQFNHKHHVFFPPLQQGFLIKKLRQAFVTFFPRADLFHISTRNFYSHSSAWCCLDLQGRMVCISPKMMCLLQAIILCPSSLWLVLHTKNHDMTWSASVVKTLAVTLINPSLCRIFVAVLVPASTLVFSPLPSPLWVVTLSGETQTWICIRQHQP